MCEIKINNYMRNCLEFLGANHDIYSPLEPFDTIKYILNYVTKAHKGMSITMDWVCRESCNVNMNLIASVCHIENAFLNDVETPEEEAETLVLQISITRMIREVIFVPSVTPEEWTFF